MTNLQLGICMLCGEPCNQHRYTHEKCATAYFEAKRAAMKADGQRRKELSLASNQKDI